MSKAAKVVTDKELASMSGWDIAKALGCHYSGDSDPIRHGGFFYSILDWEENGYADCIEFWSDDGDGKLRIYTGTIHRLEGKELESAFGCVGLEDGQRGNIHAQIDACKSYAGMEPNYDGVATTFGLENWKEHRIWARVRPLIERLSSGRDWYKKDLKARFALTDDVPDCVLRDRMMDEGMSEELADDVCR